EAHYIFPLTLRHFILSDEIGLIDSYPKARSGIAFGHFLAESKFFFRPFVFLGNIPGVRKAGTLDLDFSHEHLSGLDPDELHIERSWGSIRNHLSKGGI